MARTGSGNSTPSFPHFNQLSLTIPQGKTAAFLVPALHHLKEHESRVGCRCVILSPTRELALQTIRFTRELS